jgi:hypothetical protein
MMLFPAVRIPSELRVVDRNAGGYASPAFSGEDAFGVIHVREEYEFRGLS